MKNRLIDANKVEIGFDELCQSPYFKSDVNAKHGAETLMDLCVRSDSHKPNTIDPETLPIVQKLRSRNKRLKAVVKVQLERLREKTSVIDELCEKVADLDEKLQRVTKERDAAISDLYESRSCKTCALQFSDDCLLEECFEPCSAFIGGLVPYKWQGVQEVREDE